MWADVVMALQEHWSTCRVRKPLLRVQSIFIFMSKLHAISCLTSDSTQQDKTTEKHMPCSNVWKCTFFFTSVEGSYWHRVTLGEHCFVTKGLLTEEQMWRGKDAFHSYSGQQENYRHHETSHPDTKIVLLMTSHSLDMAAKGQGLQHCHTLNTHTHTHSGSYATEQVWESQGSHCCDYSSTELWGEAKSQASGLVRVSPGKVIQYSHSVCVCGGF